MQMNGELEKSSGTRSNDTSLGCLLFSRDCSRTPMGVCMLISHNVLSKWNVALRLLSRFIRLRLTVPSSSLIGYVPHELHLCHYCYWWFSPLSIVLSLCSPFSYCRHTFTSQHHGLHLPLPLTSALYSHDSSPVPAFASIITNMAQMGLVNC